MSVEDHFQASGNPSDPSCPLDPENKDAKLSSYSLIALMTQMEANSFIDIRRHPVIEKYPLAGEEGSKLLKYVDHVLHS